MKLSLNWLNDYVDLGDVPIEELVDRLTLAVCEVEGVEEVFGHLDQIHVALIESLEKHPDADRLNVCQVKDGKHTHQIVCGAPNVRAGMFAPLAIVGARLPKSEGEFLEIKPAKLRGVASNGMLCSPGELGLAPLTGEVDGLIDLETVPALAGHSGSNQLKHGTALSKLLPLKDTILDIDNKSITHRPDLWCHFGFAREIAAIYGKKLKYDPIVKRAKRQPKSDAKLPAKKIVIQDGAALAYYGRALAGVKIGPAPLYMQARLINVGQRPINNIVDASNYVMLELGQPNHTFDAKTLKSDTVTVALANPSKKPAQNKAKADTPYKCKSFTTLDGQQRDVPSDSILILDGPVGAKATPVPVALGGIMGGESSGVADDTDALFLESATFPRERIRPAIARVGLRTDSAQRFEKGQDPAKAKPAIDRLAELIAETCPDLRQGKTTGASPQKERRNKITVALSFLRARLGFDVSEKLVTDILTRLNFEVVVKGGKVSAATAKNKKKQSAAKQNPKDADVIFQITAPTYRSQYDVSIPEDIVEELGRVYGYDNVEPTAPMAKVEPTPPNRERLLSNRIKRFLATAGGYSEAFGYSFAAEADNAAFSDGARYDAWAANQNTNGSESAKATLRPAEAVAALPLKNPVFMDRPELRLSQLPGLLRQVAGNQDRFSDVRLFEFGRVYYKTPANINKPVLATESKRFTLVHLPPATTAKAPADAGMQAMLETRSEFHALLELRAFLTRLFGDVGYDNNGGGPGGCVRFRAAAADAAPAWLHPGAALEIVAAPDAGRAAGLVLGHLGILHPGVQARAELKRAAVVADLDYTAIFELADAARQRIDYSPPSVYPDSHFEISVIMDDRLGTHRPVELIEELRLPEIRDIRMLTVYRGEPLPSNKKSVSYELRAARDGGTLTGEELQTLLDRIVARLAENDIPLR
ncbi:MAG: phenylalanine--tRNA ligase subunit beta [bacterium]|nr:phenylalanine--tRNA ligase subunit beta [bacterium]